MNKGHNLRWIADLLKLIEKIEKEENPLTKTTDLHLLFEGDTVYISLISLLDSLSIAEGVWPESKQALRGVRGCLLENILCGEYPEKSIREPK